MFNLFIFLRKKGVIGFSIVEIMAVVFIVTIGMVGMLTLIYQSIKVQRLNRHTLIAYQLAQEGVELVRKIRDDNWLGVNNPFSDVLSAGSYCLAYDDIVLRSTSQACPLYINDFGFYSNNNLGKLTPYSRLITLTEIENYEEVGVLIEVDVFWTDLGGSLFNYRVETKLYDWY